MKYTYALFPGGYCISKDFLAVVIQDHYPGLPGFEPIPDDEREALARTHCEQLTHNLNYHWVGDEWVEVVPTPIPVPTLIITSVTGAQFDVEKMEITAMAGEQFTAHCEIQVMGNIYIPFSGTFRVPVNATDGREKVILANVVNGEATIIWTPKDSGIWEISQNRINRDIPVEQHLAFGGLKIFVLE
jgi:hypothetical protein